MRDRVVWNVSRGGYLDTQPEHEPRTSHDSFLPMRLNIAPSSVHVAEVRGAARQVLRVLPSEVAQDLLLALDEAVSNAVRHGSAGGGPVEVAIDLTDSWVELRVLDRGPTPVVPHLPAGPPPPTANGGRGLWLIRELADEVRVEPSGSGLLLAIRRYVSARLPVTPCQGNLQAAG
jgi:serine/threonine-protein kinase RsbW